MIKKVELKKIISSFLATMMLFQLDGVRVFADELKRGAIKENVQQTSQENTDVVSKENKSANEEDKSENYNEKKEEKSTEIIINSIELESNNINYPNGYTNIYVTTTNSQLVNSMEINYNDSYGYYPHTLYLHYNYLTNRFEGSIYANNYNPGEIYTFSNITISAEESALNSNQIIYRNDLQSNYGINPETLDYTIVKEKIGIKSLTVENKIVYPNIYKADSVNLKMEMEKPEEVNYIEVVYGSKYSDYSNFTIYMYRNYETGIFEGSTTPYNYMLGENELKEIRVGTYYGTTIVTKEDLRSYENIDLDSLTVNISAYAPNDIFINIPEAKKGDTVKVSVDLSNYPVDIDSVRLNYNYALNEEGYYSTEITLEMKYNKETGLYEAEYVVTGLTHGGMKEVYSLEIINKDHSISTIYNDGYEMNLNNANFKVNNNVDKFLYSLKIDTESNKAELSDKIKVSLTENGLVGSNFIQIVYTNIRTDEQKYIDLLYNKKTGKWEGYFNANTYDSDGVWAIDNIYLSETINGNTSSVQVYNKEFHKNKKYTKDFSKADIEVIGTLNDNRAPELLSFEVDKTQVEAGNIVTLSINTRDDLSGINDISATFSNEGREIYINNFKYNPLTGKYEGKLNITAAHLNGVYQLKNIWLVDKANNQLYIENKLMLKSFTVKPYTKKYEDLSTANFEVINNIDSYGQILNNITIKNKEVTADDSIEIEVVLNNRCGINALNVTYVLNHNYENPRSAYLTYDSSKDKYVGKLIIDEDMEVGTWEVDDIALLDENDYSVAHLNKYMDYTLEELINSISFSIVHKEVEDLNSISLNSLNLDKNRITANETINISAKASAVNGEVRKITVEYITSSPGEKLQQIKLVETQNGFIGQFTGSKFISPGEWRVNKVILEDNEKNKKIVWNTSISENSGKHGMNLSNANFEVYGTVLDEKAPELLDVIIDKETVVLGEKIKVSIKAKDDVSGIKTVKARFCQQQSGGPLDALEFVYNKENGMFEYTIDTAQSYSFFENWANGEAWTIVDLYMEDNAGNVYQSDFYKSEILRAAYFYVDATEKWFVADLNDKSQFVNGVTEANATIEVVIGGNTYRSKSDMFGKFKIAIPRQEGNTVVNIKITNALGIVIQEIEKVVKDVDAPSMPMITTVVNNKTTVLEGTTEANAVVVVEKEVKVFGGVKIEEVARTIADSNGKFKVTIPMQTVNTSLGIKAIDKVGNVSDYTNLIVKNINRADVNYDDIVDIIDIALVGRQYNSMDGDEEWDSDLDVNEDEIVDIFDIIKISIEL